MTKTTVLGIGWNFPLSLDTKNDQRFSIAEYEESVGQSIRIILSTAKGERIMRPTFGCGLSELVFAVNNSTTHATAKFEVTEALKSWEPRIEVIGVETATAGDRGEQMLIFIDYRVRTTDNRFNLVYPFYLDRPHT
jgi:phage baseplate assembly protein W